MSDDGDREYFYLSVNASTNHEIREKIRHSNKKNKHIERLPDWRKSIAKILTYLDESPFEMIYDPADDGLPESYQLERFLAVEFDRNVGVNSSCYLYYCEFDHRYIAHEETKGFDGLRGL